MCANGVPHELIIGIFEDAIADIKGFKDRVWNNAVTENDQQLIALCNDVSRYTTLSVPLDFEQRLTLNSIVPFGATHQIWLQRKSLASRRCCYH